MFTNAVNLDKGVPNRKFSFRSDHLKKVAYDEFQKAHSELDPMEISIKESSPQITEILRKDIIIPSFYRDVARLQDITFYQGSHFIDKPHYSKQEQVMCAIDGMLSIGLVPHVNR